MIWPIIGTSHVSLRLVLVGLLGPFLTLLIPAFFFGVTSLSTKLHLILGGLCLLPDSGRLPDLGLLAKKAAYSKL